MASRISLDQLKIASPCGMDWNEMQGDDRSRFCSSCQKHVYNFAAMTTEEGLALIEAKEGKLCGRLTRRYDGTVLTADCPVGLAAKMKRFHRRLVYGAIAAGLYILAFWWFSTSRLDDPTRCAGDQDAFAEKLEEWVDNIREWAGLPAKRPKPVYPGEMLIPINNQAFSQPCQK
jgi:hypothetical protein